MEESKPPGKIVFQESLQHPLTLFPTAVGILGSLTTLLFGTTTLSAGLALGGLGLGAGSWLVNYFFRKEIFLREHLMRVRSQAEHQMQLVLKSLEANLKKTPLPEDAKEYANQALQQFGLIQKSFTNFRQILSDKLDPREITFNRFLMTAEQVNLAVVDNLQSIATRLKSIGGIDADYIRNRLALLAKLKSRERADEDETTTLMARQELRAEQMSKVNSLLTYNEEALTQLARANAAVIEMQGKGGHSSMELNEATKELEEIAKRAKSF